MKKVFFVMSLLVLLGIIYIMLVNLGINIDINYTYTTSKLPTDSSQTNTLNFAFYTLFILLSGIFVGAGTLYMFLSATKEKVKAYERELERASVSGKSNASKVDVLEAKIKTLENAFNTVIDERTKLEVQIKSLNAEIEQISKDK